MLHTAYITPEVPQSSRNWPDRIKSIRNIFKGIFCLWKETNLPNYQGVFLRGYGGQTSYHYGAVGHWSAGLGELQGDGIREISASFSTGGQHGIGGASGSFRVTGGQGYD